MCNIKKAIEITLNQYFYNTVLADNEAVFNFISTNKSLFLPTHFVINNENEPEFFQLIHLDTTPEAIIQTYDYVLKVINND